MISVYQLKPRFQQALQPIAIFLYSRGITANQVTITAILLSLGLGLTLCFYQTYTVIWLLLPLGLLLRMALNALDGMMAREFKMTSKLGEILNEVGDIISDLFIITPFVLLSGIHPAFIILFALLSILNEFAGLLGKVISGIRRYEGPMGKSDRALLIGLFSLVYFFWQGIENYGNWIFGMACCLLLLSTFTRLRKALLATH